MGVTLYNKKYSINLSYKGFARLMQTIADLLNSEFGELYKKMEFIRNRQYKVLMDFDKACDNIIKNLASLADEYEIKEDKITIIKKVKTLVLKEE